MKYILTFLLFIITLSGFAQTYISIGAGKNTYTFITDFKIGYEFKNVIAEGRMLVSLDDVNPVWFGMQTGYNINISKVSVTPLIGYNYRMVSTDKKVLNGWVYNYGCRAQCDVVYGEFTRMDGIYFITVGLKKSL